MAKKTKRGDTLSDLLGPARDLVGDGRRWRSGMGDDGLPGLRHDERTDADP